MSIFAPGASPSAPAQTVDTIISLVTLDAASSTTLPASIIPKDHRGDVGPHSSSRALGHHVQPRINGEASLQRRDQGTRLVRQKRTLSTYPEDLSVFAWAPGVPSIAGVDYIFEETKGENTWAYLVDGGVSYRHWVCFFKLGYEIRAILKHQNQEFQNNWKLAQGLGKTNIDEEWIYGPRVPQVKADDSDISHGVGYLF